MLKTKKIKKIFKDSIKIRRKNITHGEFNIERLWKRILLIFIFINLMVAVFSWYLFFQINKGKIFIVKQENTTSVNTIDRTLLNETIKSYEKILNDFNELKVNKPEVVDPSL